jgi:hypothetical protein
MILMRYDEETNAATRVLDTTKIVTVDNDGEGYFTCYTEEGEFYFVLTAAERDVIIGAGTAVEE